MEHTICVKTKDMKRTYNAINAHRTENVEEHTHTFNRTQKRSNLERMRSKRRKRAAAVYPPPYRTSRGPEHQSNPPPHPRLSPDSMKPPTDLPPLSRANFVRSVRSQSDCALRCASTGDTRAGRSCAPARCNALVHLRTECCAPGAARICCAFARCWRRLQAPNAVASPDSRSRPGQGSTGARGQLQAAVPPTSRHPAGVLDKVQRMIGSPMWKRATPAYSATSAAHAYE